MHIKELLKCRALYLVSLTIFFVFSPLYSMEEQKPCINPKFPLLGGVSFTALKNSGICPNIFHLHTLNLSSGLSQDLLNHFKYSLFLNYKQCRNRLCNIELPYIPANNVKMKFKKNQFIVDRFEEFKEESTKTTFSFDKDNNQLEKIKEKQRKTPLRSNYSFQWNDETYEVVGQTKKELYVKSPGSLQVIKKQKNIATSCKNPEFVDTLFVSSDINHVCIDNNGQKILIQQQEGPVLFWDREKKIKKPLVEFCNTQRHQSHIYDIQSIWNNYILIRSYHPNLPNKTISLDIFCVNDSNVEPIETIKYELSYEHPAWVKGILGEGPNGTLGVAIVNPKNFKIEVGALPKNLKRLTESHFNQLTLSQMGLLEHLLEAQRKNKKLFTPYDINITHKGSMTVQQELDYINSTWDSLPDQFKQRFEQHFILPQCYQQLKELTICENQNKESKESLSTRSNNFSNKLSYQELISQLRAESNKALNYSPFGRD